MPQINQRQMLPMDTVLDDRYRIVRYLASGGFGNTYIAEDTRLGGQLAIKEFFMRGTNHRSQNGTTVEVSNDENTAVFKTQLNKFRREARRIFELHNDHIIHVSDLFDANGTSYYVMDLIPGTSLAEQTRQQPLSEQETRDVALQVLDALQTMHNAGLYHLDVKPGNIMRDDRGHCTLIDFGASKQLTADERATLTSSSMAYTPGYAPVEQVAQQSKNIGPWTDFYALGATLYRLVTGAQPPEVDSDDTDPNGRQFPYPSTISITMRHAISTLMNPSRRMRPKTAMEVKALLESTLLPEETDLTPPMPDPTNEQTLHTPSPKPSRLPIPSNNTPENPTSSPSKSDNSNPSQFQLEDSGFETPSSRRWLWYTLTGIAALLIGILLITKGCRGDVKTVQNGPDSTMAITNDFSAHKSIDTVGVEIIPDKDSAEKTAVTDSVGPDFSQPISYKTCPDGNHPHPIDLGLPSGTKWACCNVGATKPEGYGGYYAWGETSEKKVYNDVTYRYSTGEDTDGDGYYEDDGKHQTLGSNICGTRYDVAYVKWGGGWQMPSMKQIVELENNCSSTWTNLNGVAGYKFTSKKNGGSIFFPASGGRSDTDLIDCGVYGEYRSGTLDPNSENYEDAYGLFFGNGNDIWGYYSRRYGFSVRAVTR